jgi:hypothetical protein
MIEAEEQEDVVEHTESNGMYDVINGIVDNLYTNIKADWIKKLDNELIIPRIIQGSLIKDDKLRVQVRWLDKYVDSIPPKMYLSLAWSVLPKVSKKPFIDYKSQKKIVEEEEFDFILKKIRKHFSLSDNDYRANKERILKEIKKDMPYWFSWYGIAKKYWKHYYVNFELIKQFDVRVSKPVTKGLEKWGL